MILISYYYEARILSKNSQQESKEFAEDTQYRRLAKVCRRYIKAHPENEIYILKRNSKTGEVVEDYGTIR